jgi:hypothetical protein
MQGRGLRGVPDLGGMRLPTRSGTPSAAARRAEGLMCARRGRRRREAHRSRGDTAAMCNQATQSKLKDTEVGVRGNARWGRHEGPDTLGSTVSSVG